jgi:hypothetical protein
MRDWVGGNPPAIARVHACVRPPAPTITTTTTAGVAGGGMWIISVVPPLIACVIVILPPPIARVRMPTPMTMTMMTIPADHCIRLPPSPEKRRDGRCWRTIIVIVINATLKTAGKIGHRGGKDGNGMKSMMLCDRRCRRSEAYASSVGRRAQIVIIRMTPPRRRWAMNNATDNAKTYGHCGGEDGDGTKTMMLHDCHCWCSEACASSAGRRVQIFVFGMMPPRGRWAMDNVTDNAKTYGHCGGEDGDGTKMMMLRNCRCQRS